MLKTGNDIVDRLALLTASGLRPGIGSVAHPFYTPEAQPMHNSNRAESRVDISDPSQKPLVRNSRNELPFDFGVVQTGKKPVTLTDRLVADVADRKAPKDGAVDPTDNNSRLLGGYTDEMRPAIKAQFSPQPVSPVVEAVPVASNTPNPLDNQESTTGLYRPNPVAALYPPSGQATIHFGVNESFPLSIPVWSKAFLGAESAPVENGGLIGATVPKGDYIIHFSMPLESALANLPAMDINQDVPFSVSGKQMISRKATFDPKTGKGKMWVTVAENVPILLLGLITAAASAVGFAGFGLAKTVDRVDKVIVDLGGNAWKIAVAVGIGLAAWYGIPYLIKKRG